MRVNEKHILEGDGIRFVPTTHKSGICNPKFVVMHFTCMLSIDGVVSWFKNDASKASAHLILDLDGTLTQMVPFNEKAWHAGASFYKGHSDLNAVGIGIEIINYGECYSITPDGKYVVPRRHEEFDVKKYGKVEDWVMIPDEKGKPVWWHKYTKAQLATLDELVPLLIDHYKIREVVGHSDIAIPKGRKNDPGPAFPMDFYRQFADHSNSASAGNYVATVDDLNVRGGPGAEFSVLAKLKRGDTVKVLNFVGDHWAMVQYDNKKGYVHTGYLMKS